MNRGQNVDEGAQEGGARKPPVKKAEGEAAVLAKIAEMPAPYRAMGQRLHEIIMGAAPGLAPRTWYGMPAYARDGSVVCFFRVDKHMTFGLTEDATLVREEGAAHQLMPSAWFFAALDEPTEAQLAAIVRRSAS